MIQIRNLSKQYGSKILFDSAEATFGNRSRVALVGPNGAGKSTLIRMILSQEYPDTGEIIFANHLSIGHLAQEAPKVHDSTVIQEVMRLDGRRENLLQAKQELEEKFALTSAKEADLERYGRVLEELEHLDEYRLESRSEEILLGIGFKPSDFHRPLSQFSGGWLMRVALARLLLLDPDLLLLDEPTNHLDLESLLWLEDFLKNYQGAILLVSHDRLFLNRLVNEVLEIDQQKLWTYKGNLDSYVEQKQARLDLLKSQFIGQQAKIAEMEKFIARFGAKATKARQAQSRQKQLDKMEKIELPDDVATVRFRFPPVPHSGKEVVTMSQASVNFVGDSSEKKVFENLNWVIPRGSRVAVVGVNGAGKTTLLRVLADQLPLAKGELKYGHMVKVGYYAQHQAESLDFNKTILEQLETIAPDLPLSQVRAIAGAFLFQGDAVHKKCGVLSGGEKARVALAKLLLSPANFLILDEPTNHLDIESKSMLLEALQNYEGTLCLVSHDRAFVSPLVDQVLEIQPSHDTRKGAAVIPILGNYEDYLKKKSDELQILKTMCVSPKKSILTAPSLPNTSLDPSQKTVQEKVQTSSLIKAKVSNNQLQNLKKEREQIEKDIAQLEEKQTLLLEKLGDSKIYENPVASQALIQDKKITDEILNTKILRWEELCYLIES